MPEPIIFYDLLRKGPEGQSDSEKSWSPNTVKTRYALNIKGLPYKTEWLCFTAVEPKMKELGLGPQAGGPLLYTIPTIYDPNTKQTVTESFAIAKYLDEAYPDTPRLVAPGTAGLQEAYLEKVVGPLLSMLIPHIAVPVFEQCCMNDADRVYVRETREKWFGQRFEDMTLEGEALTAACKTFAKALDAIESHAAADGADAMFVGGVAPSHVDTAVAPILTCALKILGRDHELSKVILGHEWASKYLETMSMWD